MCEMGGCRWEGVRDGRVWREVCEMGGCGGKCVRWEGVRRKCER